jgi:preprotein translocase subunit SecF
MSTTTVDSPPASHPNIFRRFISAWGRMYRGETHFDFVRRRRTWFLISGAIIVAGAISLAVQGLNLSIDFVGGTQWIMPANGVTVAQAEPVVSAAGINGATITVLGRSTAGNSPPQLSVEAKLPPGESAQQQKAEAVKVQVALAKLTHQSVNNVSINVVGASWGSQITKRAIIALIVFFLLIALYISIFFEWKMALAAIIAVAHDILVTIGIYSLTQLLVTPDTVVAFLTVLGYSLYDTIVVFDRIRDNTRGLGATGRLTYTDVVNLSMNQTLARSINTSLVAILPIFAVLVVGAQFLGAVTLQYFGWALFIGLASGAYSSIFIASPLVAMFKEREQRYTTIRERLASRGGGAPLLLTPAAAAAGALGDGKAEGGPALRSRRGGGGSAAQGGRIRPGSATKAGKAPTAAVAAPSAQAGGASGNGASPAVQANADETAGDAADVDAGGTDAAETAPAPAPRSGSSAAKSSGRPSGQGGQRPPPRPRKKGRRR